MTANNIDMALIASGDGRAIGERCYTLARELCSCDYPYHTVWGLLRAAGVTGTLLYEREALRPVLTTNVRCGTRILVAGSADIGTPSIVEDICGASGPQITIADRCPAPLALIDEYAAANRLNWRTLQADILGLSAVAPFDLALVNYTLSYIPPDLHVRFFTKLADALAPGGVLVCAAVTHAGPVTIDEKSKNSWIEATRRKIRDAGLGIRPDEDELRQLLENGAENRLRRRQWRPTLDKLRNDIEAAGLVLVDERMTPREERRIEEGRRRVEAEPSVVLVAERNR